MRETVALSPALAQYLPKMTPSLTKLQQQLREETLQRDDAVMQISPEQGQFMTWMTETFHVRHALEIGTYTGFSALCMMMGMPKDGRVITCDINPETAKIAQKYFNKANYDQNIKIHLRPALETLDELLYQGRARTFDFAFIDADKINYSRYYEACLRLLRPGGMLLIDNVFWGGKVADPKENDADTQAIRALNQQLSVDKRVTISVIPMSDGVTLVRKR